MEFIPAKQIDGSICVKLDLSDDVVVPNIENLQHLLVFPITTYTKLKKGNKDNIANSGWNLTFGLVNKFMNELSTKDKTTLAMSIVYMHGVLHDFFETGDIININKVTRELSIHIDTLNNEIDLCDKLRTFVVENMTIGLYERAGKRVQDTKELTFLPDHVIDLTTIALLCKMFCPIFGVIMFYLNKQIETKLKETHCVAILVDLFRSKYQPLIEKLQYYIKHIVNQEIEESMSSLMHGYNVTSLSFNMYTQLLVRQFVNVNLGIKDGNLITYIMVSVKRALGTTQTAILQKPTYSRKPMSAASTEDEGNLAQIEIDSMVSKKTMEVVPLIKVAIPKTIEKYCSLFNIEPDEYEASLNYYYTTKPIIPNHINKCMNAMFYSKDFGGGSGILMLHSPEYTKITALLQMVLFSQNIDYIPLAHVLTALPSSNTNLNMTINESIFKLNAGASEAYRSCRQRFENSPYGTKGKEWDNYIQQLTDSLITNNYIYNTSPFLWNFMGLENKNGLIMKPDELIITGLCSFYDLICKIGSN